MREWEVSAQPDICKFHPHQEEEKEGGPRKFSMSHVIRSTLRHQDFSLESNRKLLTLTGFVFLKGEATLWSTKKLFHKFIAMTKALTWEIDSGHVIHERKRKEIAARYMRKKHTRLAKNWHGENARERFKGFPEGWFIDLIAGDPAGTMKGYDCSMYNPSIGEKKKGHDFLIKWSTV